MSRRRVLPQPPTINYLDLAGKFIAFEGDYTEAKQMFDRVVEKLRGDKEGVERVPAKSSRITPPLKGSEVDMKRIAGDSEGVPRSIAEMDQVIGAIEINEDNKASAAEEISSYKKFIKNALDSAKKYEDSSTGSLKSLIIPGSLAKITPAQHITDLNKGEGKNPSFGYIVSAITAKRNGAKRKKRALPLIPGEGTGVSVSSSTSSKEPSGGRDSGEYEDLSDLSGYVPPDYGLNSEGAGDVNPGPGVSPLRDPAAAGGRPATPTDNRASDIFNAISGSSPDQGRSGGGAPPPKYNADVRFSGSESPSSESSESSEDSFMQYIAAEPPLGTPEPATPAVDGGDHGEGYIEQAPGISPIVADENPYSVVSEEDAPPPPAISPTPPDQVVVYESVAESLIKGSKDRHSDYSVSKKAISSLKIEAENKITQLHDKLSSIVGADGGEAVSGEINSYKYKAKDGDEDYKVTKDGDGGYILSFDEVEGLKGVKKATKKITISREIDPVSQSNIKIEGFDNKQGELQAYLIVSGFCDTLLPLVAPKLPDNSLNAAVDASAGRGGHGSSGPGSHSASLGGSKGRDSVGYEEIGMNKGREGSYYVAPDHHLGEARPVKPTGKKKSFWSALASRLTPKRKGKKGAVDRVGDDNSPTISNQVFSATTGNRDRMALPSTDEVSSVTTGSKLLETKRASTLSDNDGPYASIAEVTGASNHDGDGDIGAGDGVPPLVGWVDAAQVRSSSLAATATATETSAVTDASGSVGALTSDETYGSVATTATTAEVDGATAALGISDTYGGLTSVTSLGAGVDAGTIGTATGNDYSVPQDTVGGVVSVGGGTVDTTAVGITAPTHGVSQDDEESQVIQAYAVGKGKTNNALGGVVDADTLLNGKYKKYVETANGVQGKRDAASAEGKEVSRKRFRFSKRRDLRLNQPVVATDYTAQKLLLPIMYEEMQKLTKVDLGTVAGIAQAKFDLISVITNKVGKLKESQDSSGESQQKSPEVPASFIKDFNEVFERTFSTIDVEGVERLSLQDLQEIDILGVKLMVVANNKGNKRSERREQEKDAVKELFAKVSTSYKEDGNTQGEKHCQALIASYSGDKDRRKARLMEMLKDVVAATPEIVVREQVGTPGFAPDMASIAGASPVREPSSGGTAGPDAPARGIGAGAGRTAVAVGGDGYAVPGGLGAAPPEVDAVDSPVSAPASPGAIQSTSPTPDQITIAELDSLNASLLSQVGMSPIYYEATQEKEISPDVGSSNSSPNEGGKKPPHVYYVAMNYFQKPTEDSQDSPTIGESQYDQLNFMGTIAGPSSPIAVPPSSIAVPSSPACGVYEVPVPLAESAMPVIRVAINKITGNKGDPFVNATILFNGLGAISGVDNVAAAKEVINKGITLAQGNGLALLQAALLDLGGESSDAPHLFPVTIALSNIGKVGISARDRMMTPLMQMMTPRVTGSATPFESTPLDGLVFTPKQNRYAHLQGKRDDQGPEGRSDTGAKINRKMSFTGPSTQSNLTKKDADKIVAGLEVKRKSNSFGVTSVASGLFASDNVAKKLGIKVGGDITKSSPSDTGQAVGTDGNSGEREKIETAYSNFYKFKEELKGLEENTRISVNSPLMTELKANLPRKIDGDDATQESSKVKTPDEVVQESYQTLMTSIGKINGAKKAGLEVEDGKLKSEVSVDSVMKAAKFLKGKIKELPKVKQETKVSDPKAGKRSKMLISGVTNKAVARINTITDPQKEKAATDKDHRLKPVYDYINLDYPKRNTIIPEKDRETVGNFVRAVQQNQNETKPKTPYRGVGMKLDIMKYGSVDGEEDVKFLRVGEVFEPENGRFKESNWNSLSADKMKGATITKLKNVKGEEIDISELLKDEEGQKQIASIFHSQAEIKFTIKTADDVSHDITCDNRINKTAIFAPTEKSTADNAKFSALSSQIDYKTIDRDNYANTMIEGCIERGVAPSPEISPTSQKMVNRNSGDVASL